MNEYKGIMPTKIELTLEQSQQCVSNDVLVSIEGVEEVKRNVRIKGLKKEALHTTLGRNRSIHNLSVFTKMNSDIEDDIMDPVMQYKRRCCSLIPAESDSLPHAHTQATKTYYKHQDSRINKAQELNTKTSANSDIQDLPKSYQDYQDNDCQGRLLASFQDDA
ncbi:hypothetical protein Tco_0957902 [Tanacetum coccineum]